MNFKVFVYFHNDLPDGSGWMDYNTELDPCLPRDDVQTILKDPNKAVPISDFDLPLVGELVATCLINEDDLCKLKETIYQKWPLMNPVSQYLEPYNTDLDFKNIEIIILNNLTDIEMEDPS